jgi:hypothetical protein
MKHKGRSIYQEIIMADVQASAHGIFGSKICAFLLLFVLEENPNQVQWQFVRTFWTENTLRLSGVGLITAKAHVCFFMILLSLQ